ncbi:MAG: ABC transporter permease [Defluviitaleaceae bacterium]|nr:ABC transporter permease [Defluviitaleaceae bacterium]
MKFFKNKLLQMILRRIIQSVIVLLFVTLLVFLVMQAVPGDPIINFLGEAATPEQIAYFTALFGFDQPVLVQYFRWITGLFQGEMGRSVTFQMQISDIIFERLGTTLLLVIPAFIISVVFGVAFGVIAALRRGKFLDSAVTFFANVGMAMPNFWMGILGIYIFALTLGVLPVQGFVSPTQDLGESIHRLIMPVIITASGPLAVFTRQTRSAMLEVVRQDYVRTAEAKGLDSRNIIIKHQLRNALIPIVTVMGVMLGAMIGTTVLIESIFVIPGIGSLMITAIRSSDYLVIQNGVLLLAVAVCVCNLAVDILYGVIDPRIRDAK